MAPIPTESNSRQFRRREWLLLIGLLLMVEYWIFSVSHAVSSEQSTVNYVSFASSIASILLAVIAIIYSFVQSDAQQKAGSAIASQVDHLKNASAQLNYSKEQLKQQLDRVHAATEKIDSLQDLMGGKFTNVEEALTQIRKDISSQFNAPTTVKIPRKGAVEENTWLAAAILGNTTINAELFAFALHMFLTVTDGSKNVVDFLADHYARPLLASPNNKLDLRAHLYVGNQIMATLEATELLSANDDKINPSVELKNYLSSAAKALQESSRPKISANLPLIKGSFDKGSVGANRA